MANIHETISKWIDNLADNKISNADKIAKLKEIIARPDYRPRMLDPVRDDLILAETAKHLAATYDDNEKAFYTECFNLLLASEHTWLYGRDRNGDSILIWLLAENFDPDLLKKYLDAAMSHAMDKELLREHVLQPSAILEQYQGISFTAFDYVIQRENWPGLRKLLAVFNIGDDRERVELQYGIMAKYLHNENAFEAIINELTTNPKFTYNCFNNNQNISNYLLVAVDRGNLALVQALINKGADVNYNAVPHRGSPILVASREKQPVIAKFLIEHGAQVTPDTLDSLLQQALQQGHVQTATFFITKGANMLSPHIPREEVANTFVNAVASNDRPVVQLMLDRGMNINTRDSSSGETALTQAAKDHNIEMYNFLLERRADPTIPNSREQLAQAILDIPRVPAPVILSETKSAAEAQSMKPKPK